MTESNTDPIAALGADPRDRIEAIRSGAVFRDGGRALNAICDLALCALDAPSPDGKALEAVRAAWPPMGAGMRDREPPRNGIAWLRWFCGMVHEWAHLVPPADARLATEIAQQLADNGGGKVLRDLRALRAWVTNHGRRQTEDVLSTSQSILMWKHAWNPLLAEIDRLTSAPVADAEVAPVREGALQGTPTRMTDADRREVDALKKRAFDEASAIVEPTPAEWCDQIIDVVARSRTRTGLSEPIRLDMDEIVCDRSELERAAKWLRTALADMLAVAQQVGIVYEAEGHAPVAGPTPAILRAITKMQRDAGDADQLRSAGLSLRAENARLQAELAAAEQRQQNAEGIAAQLSVRAEKAEGEAQVAMAERDRLRAEWSQGVMATVQMIMREIGRIQAEQPDPDTGRLGILPLRSEDGSALVASTLGKISGVERLPEFVDLTRTGDMGPGHTARYVRQPLRHGASAGWGAAVGERAEMEADDPPYTDADKAKLTAAVTGEREGDYAGNRTLRSYRDEYSRYRAGVELAWLQAAVDELCRRALAGKEPKP